MPACRTAPRMGGAAWGRAVVLINGRPPTIAGLARFATVNDGHFTAMQVRGGKARGIEWHLRHLVEAHRHLYDAELNPQWVRSLMRQAVADRPDASMTVTITQADGPVVMTAVGPPEDAGTRPVSLLPVLWQRAISDIRHVGTFPQLYYAREAERLGFDDALLTDQEGRISEAAAADIAFLTADGLIWPDVVTGGGVTRLLLRQALGRTGSRTRKVRLQDLSAYPAAVLVGPTGITPVSQIAGYSFPDSEPAAELIRALYASLEPEPL